MSNDSEIQGTADGRTPGHYQGKSGMQPFDIIDAFRLGFYDGNFVKYLIRWKQKNGLEDLSKARRYLDLVINRARDEPRTTGIRVASLADAVDVISGAFALDNPETSAIGYVLRWRWSGVFHNLIEAKLCMDEVMDRAIDRQQREIAAEVVRDGQH